MVNEVILPNGMENVFLLPGELCVADMPVIMATILGSCVAVCIYHRYKAKAGMNHFMLDRCSSTQDSSGKYGDTSTEYLIRRMMLDEADPKTFEAKILGGSDITVGYKITGSIGSNNIEVARKVLNKFKIPIVREDVGGHQGRKVYFNTQTKLIDIRYIQSHKNDSNKGKIRVLIVDDSEIVRKVLRKDIESCSDFEVCGEASNSFEARNLVLETLPDVISLDIIMLGMDGMDFLKRIMHYNPTPVVIVSNLARAGSIVEKRAKELGAAGIIDKEGLELAQGIKGARDSYLAALRTASKRIVTGIN